MHLTLRSFDGNIATMDIAGQILFHTHPKRIELPPLGMTGGYPCMPLIQEENRPMKTLPNPRSVFGDLPVAVYRMDCRIDGQSGGDRTDRKRSEEDRPLAQNHPRAAATVRPSVFEHLYWGSAWRGLLGWELQRLLCPFPRRPVCKPCLIRRSCPYFRLMEDQSEDARIQEAPRGYVLYPTMDGEANHMHLSVTLFGDCIRYAPVVFKALQNGEQTGIGASRVPYTLLSVQERSPQGTNRDIPLDFDRCSDFGHGAPLSEWLGDDQGSGRQITCKLTTPVRLRKNGKYLGRMDWPYFFATLIRRLESLGYLFASSGFLGKERYREMIDGFSDLRPQSEQLRWSDYSRWSNRQRRKVPMGGLVGEARFEAEAEALQDWFSVARLVHVGKGTSMGLGKIETVQQGVSPSMPHGGDFRPFSDAAKKAYPPPCSGLELPENRG